MFAFSTIGAVLASAIGLLLLLGPAVVYIVTRSVGQGRAPGLGVAKPTLTGPSFRTIPEISRAEPVVDRLLKGCPSFR